MKSRQTTSFLPQMILIFGSLALAGCGDTSMPPKPTLGGKNAADAADVEKAVATETSPKLAGSPGSSVTSPIVGQPAVTAPAAPVATAPWTPSPAVASGTAAGSTSLLNSGGPLGSLSGLLGSVFSTATGLLGGILTVPQNLLGFVTGGNGP
ncbi:MAG: hypothetical protein FJ146_16595 [Deltaproteobacteria bacterium]|nr:hypothetical protein [Deltaproteobacteria bacterium]